MAEFFDYDPDTGVRTDFDYNAETGQASLIHTQDVEKTLEQAKLFRNEGWRDEGIKENWFHYCDIPLVFVMKLRQMGIKLDDSTAVIQAVNTYWPFLKYTRKNEGTKLGTSVDMGANTAASTILVPDEPK